ncbi:hypothetical protein [Streptomyces sp. Rer75]|uniref:hypothetical protein n=1 Tax=Streptomyces sp. Rer75 TaxID=2750011 RepID=UPI00211E04C5|nr:hypothetical protein [Streptomyces sp. Rer75]
MPWTSRGNGGTRICSSFWSRSWCGNSPPLPSWSAASTRCCFEEAEHLLPPLAPLTEGPAVEITFTVWGLMGGVTYRLEEDDVYVHIHSRMDADDGEHYRVAPDGWTKVRSPRPHVLTGERARPSVGG